MAIDVRYPGRACLLGEHCDWGGGASVAVPLPLGVAITVEAAERDIRIVTELEGQLLEGRWPVAGGVDPAGGSLRFVPAAAHALTARGLVVPPLLLWVRSTLPCGRGFSSSAAFSLAVLDALAQAAGHTLPARELADLSFHVENELLGISCGRLDQMACAAGSPVFFRWPIPASPESVLDPDEIYVRPIELGAPLHLAVGAFSAPRDTAGILAALNHHYWSDLRTPHDSESGPLVRRALTEFASLAEAGARSMEEGDARALGAAMNTAQRLYEELLAARIPQLSAWRLERACRMLRELGALGAKFSGAGGDGSVIALFSDGPAASRGVEALRESGVVAWPVCLEAL